MADAVEFSITGLEELLGKLDEVSFDMKRKGGRFALRRAAQVIRDAAQQNAKRLDDPETGRQIAANIVERWNGRLFKSTGNLGFRVGVQHGAVMPEGGNQDTGMNGPTPHWRLIELGFYNKKAERDVAAQPFMRTALSNNISTAINTFVSEYDKALARAIKRAKKKAAAGG